MRTVLKGGNSVTQAERYPHIDVRMTTHQKETIVRAAMRLALTPSTWMRMIALEKAGWAPENDPDFRPDVTD